MPNENNSSAPLKTAGEPFVALGECIADQVCLSVAELPDRDSPADWPQAMLVTSDELRNIVLNAINYAAQAVAAQAPAAVAVPDEREVFEAFMRNDTSGFSLEREGETYKEFEVATYWHFWRARAALAATPEIPATEYCSAGDLATESGSVLDGGTPGPWRVRKRERDGELLDCFVEAPDCQGLPYAAEILGDDEYREGVARKLADCELIVKAVNALRAGNAQAEVQAEPVAWTDDQVIRFAFSVLLQGNTCDSIEVRLNNFRGHEALRGIPAPQAQPADALEPIRQAVRDYHYALDTRSGYGVAADTAMWGIQRDLDMPWQQDQEADRRAAMAAAQEGGNAATGKDGAA